jgi:hypothetical protein
MRSTVLLALAPLAFMTFSGAAHAAPTERVTFYCQSGGADCCPAVMAAYVRGGPITLVKRGAAVYRDGLIDCGAGHGGALRVRG